MRLADKIDNLPAVALVRDAHPDAEITWVINPEFTPLLRGNPDVEHIHVFPRGEFRGLGAPRSLRPWLKITRQLQPDLALDFQGLLRSALIGKISGAKEIYGMSDAREGARWFYDRVAKVNRRDHAVERYLKLAECAGATVGAALRCPFPTGAMLPRFDEHPPFILLHPFARGHGKSLSNGVIEEFCRAFAPTRVVVVGQSDCKIDTPGNCIDLTNQTSLLQLIRLIRVACYPRRVGPYNPNAWVWKNGQLLRVSELEIVSRLRRARKFKCKDVPGVVELVRPLVPIDPMLA